jgi:GNAT superfamily N-acetyltransferase
MPSISRSQTARRVKRLFSLLRAGQYDVALQTLRERLHSRVPATGLRRDLTVPFPAPSGKIPLQVRQIRPGDIDALLAVGPDPDEQLLEQRAIQTRLLEAGLGTCYVAVDEHDRPCYMQLLIGPADNERLQRFFQGSMPQLAPDEALLEGAYTNPGYRGKGVMAAAMARIAEHAEDLGARYVLTFVHDDNIASLKGCERAGFTPHVHREERYRLFRRSVTFTPLPAKESPPVRTAPA